MQNRASLENEKITSATIGIPYESIFVEEGLSSDGNESSSTGQSSQQMRKVTGFRWWLMLVSVLSSVFLYSLDNTIVADIQPNIVDTLGGIEKLPWLSTGFLVACVATNSIWSKIYTQFDAKWTYVLCIVLFEAGSALCGAAPTMNFMIGGRVLAGLGGVGLYIGVITLLSLNTTENERPACIGLIGLTWGLGTVLGPIIGGSFAESKAGWRWAFYLNLFIAAIAAPVYLFIIPPNDPQPGVSSKARLSKLDYLGNLLILGASISGVLAINCGGVIYPWNDARTIAPFAVSGVLFTLFGLQQSYCFLTTEDDRTFPCHFLRSKTHVVLFVHAAASSSLFFPPIYFIPLYFQFVRGDSAIEAGIRLLPLVVPLVVAIIANGSLMPRYGYHTPWYLAGAGLALAGGSLLYTVTARTPIANIYGYMALLGLGAGMYAQAGVAVAQAQSRPRDAAWAVGFVALGQLGGATVALAVANSVFVNRASAGVLAVAPGASPGLVRGALSGVGSTLLESLDAAARSAALDALANAIGCTYVLSIAGAALSIAIVPFMPWEKLFSPVAVLA